MIINNSSSNGTDLWALGCIIYKMITGYVPFSGTNEILIQSKILKRDLDYPAFLDYDSIDIINSLLQMNPEDRLGAGSPGS